MVVLFQYTIFVQINNSEISINEMEIFYNLEREGGVMRKYAIVGFGCAGYCAAKTLSEHCPGSQIDVYSKTSDAPANPMLTTYYAAGKIPREQLFPFGSKEEILNRLPIHLIENTTVTRVHAVQRKVETEDGAIREYDDIVIATGSEPLVFPIPGCPEEDVYVMRTPADADAFLDRIHRGMDSALVIGASWVGIKMIEVLKVHGIKRMILADMAPRIFPTATLPQTAERIHDYLKEEGVDLLFGSGIQSMRREKDGIVSIFSDGTEVKTDVVALCLGMRSCVQCLNREEIAIGRAVQVNARMQTSVPHIYAAGDCCEALELVTGQYMAVNLWANARMQGEVAALNIAGIPAEYQGNILHNIAHFLNMDFIGLGDNRAKGEQISHSSPQGWQLDMVAENGKILCVNILDNRGLSGPLKAILLKRLSGSGHCLNVDEIAALKKAGLPCEIIRIIEGGEHGNT